MEDNRVKWITNIIVVVSVLIIAYFILTDMSPGSVYSLFL